MARVGRARKQVTVRFAEAADGGAVVDLCAAEDLLARLVAKAFAADHPEYFSQQSAGDAQDSGLPAAAAAVAGALPANAGSLEKESGERNDGNISSKVR